MKMFSQLLLPLVIHLLTIPWTRTTYGAVTQTGPYLSLGASLRTNETWLSENGTFTMGFFAVPANSSSLYLGVWYSGVPIASVWLLVRDKAVTAGASLTVGAGGNLTLADADGSQVWVSNTAADGVADAAFLENGNLVLRNASGATVWDSFDYPIDTFLPGMTIRVSDTLVSWKSASDPSPGLYKFNLVKQGELHFTWNDSVIYYNSGPWTGSYFANPPHLGISTPPDKFHYSNSSGSPTFMYTTSGRSVTNDVSLKRFRLDPDGNARQHIWVIEANNWQTFIDVPVEPCDAYHTCGQNSVCNNTVVSPVCSCLPGFGAVNSQEWASGNFWSHGCQRSSPATLKCTNSSASSSSSSDAFLSLANVVLEGDSVLQTFSNNSSATDCMERCLQNCTCGGYSYTRTNCTLQSTSAVLYNAIYSNSSSTSVTMFLRVPATNSSTSIQPSRGGHATSTFSGAKLIATVVLCSALGFLLLVALVVWWFLRKSKRSWPRASNNDPDVVGVIRFSYKELVYATENFKRQVGSGGFGTVFRGVLADNISVAVKTLGKLRQGEREFKTEVAVIGTIHHINLVQLQGYCADGDHRALVYEYVPNGSLEKYLFKKSDPENGIQVLDWRTRLNIAVGAARGIAYLHHECRSKIIHCDIKPENILLEADFTPKVSDFGLAKLLSKDVSKVVTNIRGTRGYLAPEWLTNSTLTSKVDVYSFGMTLLELVCGRRTVDLSGPSERWFLAVWAFHQMKTGQELRDLVDDRLAKDDVDEEELKRTLRVGLWCTQDDPDLRPSMRDVVKMLEGTLDVADVPSPPSYAQTASVDDNHTHRSEDSQMEHISYEYTQVITGR